jgi:2'-5' RNA ligase
VLTGKGLNKLADRNEHLVVVMVERSNGGEFEIWPLHITLVPWFPCDDELRLDQTLQLVASRHKPINVKTGIVEEWGRHEKFIVQTVGTSPKLQKLHLDIFGSLENNGFHIHQKDFLGEKYKPHLTLRNRYQKSEALPGGTIVKINKFALIKQIRLKKTGTMIKSVSKEYKLNG